MCAQHSRGKAFRQGLCFSLLFGLALGPVRAQDNPVPQTLLIQKMKDVNKFVREHTGYKTLTLPRVVFLGPDEMETLRYGNGWRGKGYPEVVALAKKGVIYLPNSFELGRDDYILAHELTLYQEFESGKHWLCTAAMEPEAYRVQSLWVKATGRGQLADMLGPLAYSDCGLNP